jgi:hypothetical protein
MVPTAAVSPERLTDVPSSSRHAPVMKLRVVLFTFGVA